MPADCMPPTPPPLPQLLPEHSAWRQRERVRRRPPSAAAPRARPTSRRARSAPRAGAWPPTGPASRWARLVSTSCHLFTAAACSAPHGCAFPSPCFSSSHLPSSHLQCAPPGAWGDYCTKCNGDAPAICTECTASCGRHGCTGLFAGACRAVCWMGQRGKACCCADGPMQPRRSAPLDADETGWCVPCASNGCAACSADGACTECNSYLVRCGAGAALKSLAWAQQLHGRSAAGGPSCPLTALRMRHFKHHHRVLWTAPASTAPALRAHAPSVPTVSCLLACLAPARSCARPRRRPRPRMQAMSASVWSVGTRRTLRSRPAPASPAPRAAASAPPPPTAPSRAACAAMPLPPTPAATAWRAPQIAPRATAPPARARPTRARPALGLWATSARSVPMPTAGSATATRPPAPPATQSGASWTERVPHAAPTAPGGLAGWWSVPWKVAGRAGTALCRRRSPSQQRPSCPPRPALSLPAAATATREPAHSAQRAG